MSTDFVLEMLDVHTHVAQHHILQGMNFSIRPGRVTTLLGRNGAGKTSTLKSIMGLYPAQQGKILLNKLDIRSHAPFQVARQGVGYVPEDQGIFYHLTVQENMTLAKLKNDEETEGREERLLDLFPDLRKFWKVKGGLLSGGQRQMLSVARAVVNPNQLLLIDEPSKGLAPIVIDRLIEALNTLKQTETIILVEQNFHMATECGDDYHIIDDGRTVHSGEISDLVNNEAVKQKYLGIG